MKTAVAFVACLAVVCDARVRDLFRDQDLVAWDDPMLFEDPQAKNDCDFNQCNSAVDPRNACVEGTCLCAQGFKGRYCTCDGLCDTPFGTCTNDASGTCKCNANWKGRNCNCHVTCPDSPNWRCVTGDTEAERDCICRVDGKPWVAGKQCCPTLCTGLMSCPKDDGVCLCPTTNTKIPYGSSADRYKCCPTFCKLVKDGGYCDCGSDGCIVVATGLQAVTGNDCWCPVFCKLAANGGYCECGPDGCIVTATGKKATNADDCTCPDFCKKGGLCTCSANGCFVTATGLKATSASDCRCEGFCKLTSNGGYCECAETGCIVKATSNPATNANDCRCPTFCKLAANGGYCDCGPDGCTVTATGKKATDPDDCTCPDFCKKGGLCTCSPNGCVVTATGVKATTPRECICPGFCKEVKDGGVCECRADGCYIKASGVQARNAKDCNQPEPPASCATHNSWQECSIVHWQGRCQCDATTGCRCKCWYGWAGGQGTYELPGWDRGFKALYSQHCRNRCDWTHQFQPSRCSACVEVPCPDCSPSGAKKCAGTY